MEERFAPAVIHNADIPILAEVLAVMQEVRLAEEQKEWRRERLTNFSPHLTGMPGGGGIPKGMEEAFAAISELEEEAAKKCVEYARTLKRAQDILNGIENTTMRTFVTMKYVFDISDVEIRRELGIKRRGFERARKAVEEAPNMASVQWEDKYILAKDD